MENICTANLAEFGNREKAMAAELLTAMTKQGLPDDFYNNEVTVMMNKYSGNVFLTNSEYQVAMMNDNKLESFYSLPYSGEEGFLEDLLELNPDNLNQEDIDYILSLAGDDDLPEAWETAREAA
jgi:hypothetical protein